MIKEKVLEELSPEEEMKHFFESLGKFTRANRNLLLETWLTQFFSFFQPTFSTTESISSTSEKKFLRNSISIIIHQVKKIKSIRV